MKKLISFSMILIACSAFAQQAPKVKVDRLTDTEYLQLKTLQTTIDQARASLEAAQADKRNYEIQLAEGRGADMHGEHWMEWGRDADSVEFKGQWIIVTPSQAQSFMGISNMEVLYPTHITDDEQKNQ
jgi:hypothetical protein